MNEEKDRFGDFMQRLERAREDVYFAAKERDLLDRLKEDQQPLQAETVRSAPKMSCPQCGNVLHRATVIDVPANRCSACGGVWLDRTVLPQFLNLKRGEPEGAPPGLRPSLRYIWPDRAA